MFHTVHRLSFATHIHTFRNWTDVVYTIYTLCSYGYTPTEASLLRFMIGRARVLRKCMHAQSLRIYLFFYCAELHCARALCAGWCWLRLLMLLLLLFLLFLLLLLLHVLLLLHAVLMRCRRDFVMLWPRLLYSGIIMTSFVDLQRARACMVYERAKSAQDCRIHCLHTYVASAVWQRGNFHFLCALSH